MKINEKVIKILKIIILFIVIINLANNVLATVDTSWVDPSINASEKKDIDDITSKVLGIVQTIGTIASVVILVVIGIRYMTGSLQEKSEMSKTLWVYVVGAIFVFAITRILGYVYNFIVNDFNSVV